MDITIYIKSFTLIVILSFICCIFLWSGYDFFGNSKSNISIASSFLEYRANKNRRRSDLRCIKNVELEEVLSLKWGNEEDEIGSNKEYDIVRIAHTFGFRYGPADFYVDEIGSIYIMDNFNSRILKYKGQKLVQSYYLPFEDRLYYSRIHVDTNGNLYIIINGSDLEIIKYDALGNYICDYSLEIDMREDGLSKIETDKNEDIYILKKAENNKSFLLKYSEDGKQKDFLINQKFSHNWHLDSQGLIYFLHKNRECDYCEIRCFKEDDVYSLFSFCMEDSDNLRFLGLDENHNFYFYKFLVKTSVYSGQDSISHGAIVSGDSIILFEGVILYKYDIHGNILKKAFVRDFIPYDIKMNLKGNIYFSFPLSTEALLFVPLDSYRIYMVSF